MWSLLLLGIFASLCLMSGAQRSFYAPRPHSKLLPRYKENNSGSEPEDLANRVGEENSWAQTSTTTTQLPPELEGTLEEDEFVQRVATWPEDRQPFWFKNRKAISSMRGQDIDGGNINEQSTGTRFGSFPQTPFLGPQSTRLQPSLDSRFRSEPRQPQWSRFGWTLF